ncbi:putative F-box only protein 32 [Apostichopus japonicus]|uniref:Putative F-box only protein 32 n=1 Tax=Stichopus japonicus TaxID=307972 RepID=A0A2G8KQX7_STIJA|nr:putative F-box only protein 32 [Apostichopus japonicus]
MPFIGKDWRSPGGLWVRTNSGWQKISAIRKNLNRHIKRVALERISGAQDSDTNLKDQDKASKLLTAKNVSKTVKFTERPKRHYLFLPTKCLTSKQRGKYLTVGEVLCSLDFCTALSDPRRFHYVCKVIELIIEEHFSTLCGSAMKYLFCILEEGVNIVELSHLFIHRLSTLLKRTKDKMLSDKNKQIGCQALYNCRLHLLGLWEKRLQEISLVEREDDGKPTLQDLPVNCQRFLLQCFSDPADVIHVAETNKHFYMLGSDPLLWEKLFFYHFTEAQLQAVLRGPITEQKIDWKLMFKRLMKRYEQTEEYTSMLQQCMRCNCIFWQEDGHPCCHFSLDETLRDTTILCTKDLSPKDLIAIITD